MFLLDFYTIKFLLFKDNDDDQENYWSDFELEAEEISEKKPEPLDTFFVKNVAPGGAADSAGLCEGKAMACYTASKLFLAELNCY